MKRIKFGTLLILIGHSINTFGITDEAKQIQTISTHLNTLNHLSLTNPPRCEEREATGCFAMVDSFCQKLHSSEHLGSMDLKLTDGRILPIKLGETQNDFSHKFVGFINAKLAAQERYPAQFKEKLKERGYFQKLKEYLITSKSISERTVQTRYEESRLYDELGSIWHKTYEETIDETLEKKYPGFINMKYLPPEVQLEKVRLQRDLEKKIDEAIWNESQEFKQSQKDFELVRTVFLKVLSDETIFSDETKPLLKKWRQSISEVIFTPPHPVYDNEKLKECDTTLWNAFYDPRNHSVTPCAGSFFASPPLSVFTHELAHAVGFGKQTIDFHRSSNSVSMLKKLTEQVCAHGPDGHCPPEWENYKANYSQHLGEFKRFQVETPKLRACLQYTEEQIKTPSLEELDRLAGDIARDSVGHFIGNLADLQRFLMVSKKEIILPDGSKHSNPQYLNPCNRIDFDIDKVTIGTEDSALAIFSAEYLCNKNQDPKEKLKQAIVTAKNITTDLVQSHFGFAGRFSGDPTMINLGFAEDSEERFADALGFKVYAQVLKEMYPNLSDRRNAYLANMAPFCLPPSIQNQYPEEAQIQKIFSAKPHSFGKKRQLEQLTPPIREALGCSLDFQTKDCVI